MIDRFLNLQLTGVKTLADALVLGKLSLSLLGRSGIQSRESPQLQAIATTRHNLPGPQQSRLALVQLLIGLHTLRPKDDFSVLLLASPDPLKSRERFVGDSGDDTDL